jgi:hypothetical protein
MRERENPAPTDRFYRSNTVFLKNEIRKKSGKIRRNRDRISGSFFSRYNPVGIPELERFLADQFSTPPCTPPHLIRTWTRVRYCEPMIRHPPSSLSFCLPFIFLSFLRPILPCGDQCSCGAQQQPHQILFYFSFI